MRVRTAGLPRPAVGLDARELDDVLMQGAAEGDVEDLDPAADRKEGDAPVDRGPRERDLAVVRLAVDPVHRLVRFLAVARGVDVGATGEDDGVDAGEQRGEIVVGVDDDGFRAGAFDRREVRARRHRSVRVRPTIWSSEPAAGDGDERYH